MTKKQQSGWLRPQQSPKGEVGWPLVGVLAATAFLWRPVLELFWYIDDYPLLYWLMHPEGPANPADVGNFKLPIYHGLLEIHWPAYQLFGLDVTAHHIGQLLLLLLAIVFVYWLVKRLTRSHLVATLVGLLLATTPVALNIVDRVSLAYQGYLVVILMAGVLLLLLAWKDRVQVGWLRHAKPGVTGEVWLWLAGLLFLCSLYLVGVRLHAAFLGLSAVVLWLGWPTPALRHQAWWFVGTSAVATLLMVSADGLGRNELALAPSFLTDLTGSIGNLLFPSNGVERLLVPVEALPASIVAYYRWLVSGMTAIFLLATFTLTNARSRLVWAFALSGALLGLGFFLASPDVSQGDLTFQAEQWLTLLAGGQVLLFLSALMSSWQVSRHQQLMAIGLGWAIAGFLPAFLVQPGATFGTTDKYFVSSLLGLVLFWTGALTVWTTKRPWLGLGLAAGLVMIGSLLVRTHLTTQLLDRAVPAQTIHSQLKTASQQWPTEARIVLLASPSSQAAYHLHEALATGTINTEAIFAVLYDLPYDRRILRIVTLEQAAEELQTDQIDPRQVFVYGYGIQDGLIDLSQRGRLLLPIISGPEIAETMQHQLLAEIK